MGQSKRLVLDRQEQDLLASPVRVSIALEIHFCKTLTPRLQNYVSKKPDVGIARSHPSGR